MGLVVAGGAVLRFIASSPLWLDEALSVNIAESSSIEAALRHDGHPPLYYLLLGWWTDIVGSGDRATRSLSAVFSIATLPFAYLTGRRIGGDPLGRLALIVLAAAPFAIRYANETRMYALVTFLAFTGWWLVELARRKPTLERLIAVTAVATLLLYTHYWSLWLLGALGIWLLIAASGRISSFNKTAAKRLIAALALSAIAFLPWLSVLLDQAANTGTPWAEPDRPSTDIVLLIFEWGGGLRSEAQLLGIAMVILLGLGLFARRGAHALTLSSISPEAREPAAMAALTLLIGLVIGTVSGSVFQPRYSAVFFPFVVILLALGLMRLRGRVAVLTLVLFVTVGLVVSGVEARTTRSQGREVAQSINADATGEDLIVWCPDQLGPATSRYLDTTAELQVFPSKESPALIDWRSYEKRNRESNPAEFAAAAVAATPRATIWLVAATNYRTYEGKCEALVQGFADHRSAELVVSGRADIFEPATLYRFDPPPN